MSRLRRIVSGVAFASLWAMAQPAAAQHPPLRFDMHAVTISARSHAPLAFEAELKWDSSELLRGDLVLTLSDYGSRRKFAAYHINDLALSNGQRKLRLQFPPVRIVQASPGDLPLLRVDAQFLSSQAKYDLGHFEFRVPFHDRRSFLIAESIPRDRALSPLGVDPQSAFDFLAHVKTKLSAADVGIDADVGNERMDVGLATASVRVLPEDMPSHGLEYFAYDIVLLAGEGFTQLRDKQLDAIASWVEGGGSVCVVADRPLTAAHVAFVTRVVGAQSRRIAFEIDPNGNYTLCAEPGADFPMLSRAGFGRAVILNQPLEVVDNSFQRAAAHLWKIRSNHPDVRNQPEEWNPTFSKKDPYASVWLPFRPLGSSSAGEMLEFLIPEDVQTIPFPVVMTILVLFLFAIAPGDYFLLGALKRRRLTWVLFPALSLAFTLFTVQLAQSYMGTTDYRSAIVVVDLGDDDRVLRTNRFELSFTATERLMETKLKDVQFVAIEHAAIDEQDAQAFAGRVVVTNRRAAGRESAIGLKLDPPVYIGSVPTNFAVQQTMRKWTPQLGRYSTLATDANAPPFSLAGVVPHDFFSPAEFDFSQDQDRLAEWGRALRQKILPKDASATILLLNASKIYDATSDLAEISEQMRRNPQVNDRRLQIVPLLEAMWRQPSQGLFSVVSQIAPTGAEVLEDLAVLDDTDPRQWLLVVMTRQGGDWVIYRKMYWR